ncbi:MAG: hypothetical protein K9J13_04390 [Saprospiraceae bacterium]|nr:hypothetical protein [Saprospiraceae bacterium]
MKKFLFTIALFSTALIINAQSPDIVWENTYGGSEDDEGKSIVQTKDGGFILVGKTESKGAGKSDVWVLKLDAAGENDWDINYGGSKDDEGFSIINTKDGGFAFAGYTKSEGKGGSDFLVVNLDLTGKEIWNKTYGGPKDDEAKSIIQSFDGNFVVSGTTKSRGAGSTDYWIVKTSGADKPIWRKNFGGSKKDDAMDIIQVADSGFVIIGNSISSSNGGSDAWIIKTNKEGRSKAKPNFGGTDFDIANSIIATQDGYIFVGGTMTLTRGFFDAWVVGLNSNFEKKWENQWGDTKDEKLEVIIETHDTCYVMAGYTQSFGEGNYDGWIIKLDKNGKKLWEKTIGGNKEDKIFDMIEAKDGSLIVCGYTKSEGDGKKDVWVVKLK